MTVAAHEEWAGQNPAYRPADRLVRDYFLQSILDPDPKYWESREGNSYISYHPLTRNLLADSEFHHKAAAVVSLTW